MQILIFAVWLRISNFTKSFPKNIPINFPKIPKFVTKNSKTSPKSSTVCSRYFAWATGPGPNFEELPITPAPQNVRRIFLTKFWRWEPILEFGSIGIISENLVLPRLGAHIRTNQNSYIANLTLLRQVTVISPNFTKITK